MTHGTQAAIRTIMEMSNMANTAPLRENSWDRRIITFVFRCSADGNGGNLNQDKTGGLISNEAMLHFFSTGRHAPERAAEESSWEALRMNDAFLN